MAGLDNITGTIISEAKKTCEETDAEFQKQADDMLTSAKADIDDMLAKAKKKAGKDYENAVLRAQSSADLKKRQVVLAAKQNAINTLVEKAYDAVFAMDENQYFDLLLEMMDEYMEEGKDGTICFSKTDLARLPKGYEEKAAQKAKSKNSKITVGKEPALIDGGFLLIYDGIEENCSIRAILNAKREIIADKVNNLLFA